MFTLQSDVSWLCFKWFQLFVSFQYDSSQVKFWAQQFNELWRIWTCRSSVCATPYDIIKVKGIAYQALESPLSQSEKTLSSAFWVDVSRTSNIYISRFPRTRQRQADCALLLVSFKSFGSKLLDYDPFQRSFHERLVSQLFREKIIIAFDVGRVAQSIFIAYDWRVFASQTSRGTVSLVFTRRYLRQRF